ncbi:hypothetical protein [Cohnella hashimotonis]|uniref:Uncharacterized protein n=1 Tax=Cohnella hashimotonis TaxID=2826895 RepID=A0ABT6TDF6_9BACL|nr:hypothetical protein [Cohnella hashimotonis]MDI4644804.1 hypothetical protein [Cohnella hashimotonis]
MPYYYFHEVWTPLKLFGIRLYRDEERALWIKAWHAKKRKLRNPAGERASR